MKRSLFLIATLALAGCRQDMYNQPRYKPLAQSDFFSDGAASRTPPTHTIARGQLREDTVFFTGAGDNGKLAAALPVPVTAELLRRGQERFGIYCAVCHGAAGEGNGMIVRRGFPAPESYHNDRLRNAPPGYFYYVITHGYGVMYSYASRVPPADRWAIVAYIKALQLSHHAGMDDVRPSERASLEGSNP